MKNLSELVKLLNPLATPIAESNPEVEAFIANPSIPNGYVWPDLRDWQSPEGARVILIEAPGAVGKTAAATAIAGRTKWPLVDASRAQVGSYSLSGLIQDALGFESTYLGELSTGRAGVIIDALDEAHLRAGSVNFRAFLGNVLSLTASQVDGFVNVVLLSRPDTAEQVRSAFKSADRPIASATLDFFDYSQACAFIHGFMKRKAEEHPGRDYGVALQHREAFEKLRDERIDEIATALVGEKAEAASSWGDVRTFLGYAPVLLVLGEYLAVGNPYAAQRRLSGVTADSDTILLEIVASILRREQEKVRDQLWQVLEAMLPAAEDWDGKEHVYSVEEQNVRLLQRHLNLQLKVLHPVTLPDSVRELYEERVELFLGDHPFLAGEEAVNVVFEDYMRAVASVDGKCRASLDPVPRSQVSEVGPFYYQFVHRFAGKNSSETASVVQENLFGLLLSSHSQSLSALNTPAVTYVQRDGLATLMLHEAHRVLEFEVDDLSGALMVPERLSRAEIITDTDVILEASRTRFLLGPQTVIHCRELAIETERMSVESTDVADKVDPSVIRAETVSITKNLSIDVFEPGALVIYGDHTWPTLRQFVHEVDERTKYDVYADYIDLRAILRQFKQQAGRLPSVYHEKMDQTVVKDNPNRLYFMERLLDLGITIRQGTHYYLDTAKLSKYEVSMPDIVNGQLTQKIVRFIDKLNPED